MYESFPRLMQKFVSNWYAKKNVYNFLVFLEKDNINFENKMASLSTIAAFDDLRRNQAVLSEGIAEEGK